MSTYRPTTVVGQKYWQSLFFISPAPHWLDRTRRRQRGKMAGHKRCQKLGGWRFADLTAPQRMTPNVYWYITKGDASKGRGREIFENCLLSCKGKGAHELKAQTAGAYFRFPKHEASQGVLLLPPRRDASPSQGYPPELCRLYPFIHLGEERKSGVKFLV